MTTKREWTVGERADLVQAAMPSIKLTAKQVRSLEEVLYTMSEAGRIVDRLSRDDAETIWALVELARIGKFTDDMRL